MICPYLKVGLPRVCFFCSTERNSEHFSLPRNGSELNSEGLLLFLFHCTEFQAFSPPRNGSERNSESFLFCGTAGILPERTNCSVHYVFRGIIFLSEIANPSGVKKIFPIGSAHLYLSAKVQNRCKHKYREGGWKG
jgi:hypothetical protein